MDSDAENEALTHIIGGYFCRNSKTSFSLVPQRHHRIDLDRPPRRE
jgi:hypothetical protein